MVFFFKTRAMTERSVEPRVFVSPFPACERGEAWQENPINKSPWHKIFSEAKRLCASCSKQVQSVHWILSTRLVRGEGSSPLLWPKSPGVLLPLKKTPPLRDNFAEGLKVAMSKSYPVISCNITSLPGNTRSLPISRITSRQGLYARFSTRPLHPVKRI